MRLLISFALDGSDHILMMIMHQKHPQLMAEMMNLLVPWDASHTHRGLSDVFFSNALEEKKGRFRVTNLIDNIQCKIYIKI